jgi:zinc transporter ZupT
MTAQFKVTGGLAAALLTAVLLAVQVVWVAGSGDDKFEWAGIFALPEDDYLWTAQKKKPATGTEKYADDSMKLVALPASSATKTVLDALETNANTILGGTCESMHSHGVITPHASKCYNLVFKQDVWQSLFSINANGHAAVAFFTQHVPTEFESTAHYLKDDHGHDIEPKATLGSAHSHGHGHSHGATTTTTTAAPTAAKDNYEWAGIFSLPEDIYLWTAQKTKPTDKCLKERYVDPAMKLTVLPATSATQSVLDSLKGNGHSSLGRNCENVYSGGTVTPMANKCYKLNFKQEWWQSLFTINATGHAAAAFFAEHVPTEFENKAHYLKDDHGHDIEPVGCLPGACPSPAPTPAVAVPSEEKHWGPAILASIFVNIVTLAGVVFLVPVVSRLAKTYAAEFDVVTAGFAAGAISSCAFFLLLFESTHLIAIGKTEEVETTWRWGIMILAGALFPVFAHLGVDVLAGCMKKKPTEQQSGDDESAPVKGGVKASSMTRIISSVLIGDFMHNLCDGFFIGAAFKGCGPSMGWTVATSTILHEFAQELGDYCVLTGPSCKLHPALALGCNFLSGTSVLLGVIIFLSSEISKADIGLLLAFGGGTYLYIALVECMPKLHNEKVSLKTRVLGTLLFVVGAVAIGLVLLDHEHCVPPRPLGAPPAPDPHAGHNH